MKKNIYFLISIFFIVSCYKENDCPDCNDLNVDITGVYNAYFTGNYIIDTIVFDWNREQLMEISKINDTLYSLCVIYDDSCIYGTTTFLKRVNTFQLEGTYYYPKTHSSDWQSDTLSGYIDNVSINGVFNAETVQKILVQSGSYTYPTYVTLPVQGTFLFTKSN